MYLSQNHDKEHDRAKMSEMISGLHGLMREKKFELIDGLLKTDINESSSVDSIVCVLRATFSARDVISSWYSISQKAKNWISAKGYSPERVLAGLG